MQSTGPKLVQEFNLNLGTGISIEKSIQSDNDLHIALRKGIRECTKHPLYHIS